MFMFHFMIIIYSTSVTSIMECMVFSSIHIGATWMFSDLCKIFCIFTKVILHTLIPSLTNGKTCTLVDSYKFTSCKDMSDHFSCLE